MNLWTGLLIMKITKWDLMKLAQNFDVEFCLSDFSEEELEKLLQTLNETDSLEDIRRKYFEFYDDIKDFTLNKHKWSD